MTGPSRHLSWDELACHDAARTPYPLAWRGTRAVELARAFEAFRAEVGEPLLVASGYRTAAWNRQIGGARASQHVEGRALDLMPVRGAWTVDRLWTVAHAMAQAGVFRGLGRYEGFLHIDVRPGRLVVWDARRGARDAGRNETLDLSEMPAAEGWRAAPDAERSRR